MSTATPKTLTAAAAAANKKGRKSASLPSETVEYLKAWMMSPEHVAHPYPTDHEKAQIMADTGIELKQLTNWFVNNRKRFWKPRVEAKLQEKGCPPPAAAGPSCGPTGRPPVLAPPRGRPGHPAAVAPTNTPAQSEQTIYAPGSGAVVDAATKNHQQPASFAPAAAIAPANVSPCRNDRDLHTISDGSGSSACNSDDESFAASSTAWARAVPRAAPAQHANTPPATATAGGNRTTSAPSPTPGGSYRRHEEVDVHVLRPKHCGDDSSSTPLPTLRDVTIKSSVPTERVLAAFKCQISYTVPYGIEHDSKKVHSRRDGEIYRVKKHYLNLYLATRGIHSASGSTGTGDVSSSRATSALSSGAADASTAQAASPLNTCVNVPTPSPRWSSFDRAKLGRDEDEVSNLPSRKRARREAEPLPEGEEQWRYLCQKAKSVYCDSLPGLEEAAVMFGFASA